MFCTIRRNGPGGGTDNLLTMKHLIKPLPLATPVTMPEPLRARMSEIHHARGTAPAKAYAHAVLSAMRHDDNVAYMLAAVGHPGVAALRAFITRTAICVPVLFAAFCFAPLPSFVSFFALVGIFIIASALIAYTHGGRTPPPRSQQ